MPHDPRLTPSRPQAEACARGESPGDARVSRLRAPARKARCASAENGARSRAMTVPRAPLIREVKLLAEPLAAVDEDGVFEGYASLFNVPDLGKDVVMPGA